MELRQLRYFVAVADTLNFCRAAESLYVSQSALSKQISELERELGVTLFNRDRRSVELTAAGQLLLPEAKDILMRSEKLAPLLRHEAEEDLPQRAIHIAVEPRAADDPPLHRALTDAVYRQRREMPGLRALFWQEEYLEIKKALQDGTMDLGVFLHPEPQPGESLAGAVLREDELVLVLRSRAPLRDDREDLLEALRKRGVILLQKEPRGLAQILALLDAVGSAPQIRFCRDQNAMTLTMESGESTAILPESAARRLPADDLRILHFRHPQARLWLLAAWPRERPSALTGAVVRRALEALRDPAERGGKQT